MSDSSSTTYEIHFWYAASIYRDGLNFVVGSVTSCLGCENCVSADFGFRCSKGEYDASGVAYLQIFLGDLHSGLYLRGADLST